MNPLQLIPALLGVLNWRKWRRNEAAHAEMLEILRRNDRGSLLIAHAPAAQSIDEAEEVKIRAQTEPIRRWSRFP